MFTEKEFNQQEEIEFSKFGQYYEWSEVLPTSDRAGQYQGYVDLVSTPLFDNSPAWEDWKRRQEWLEWWEKEIHLQAQRVQEQSEHREWEAYILTPEGIASLEAEKLANLAERSSRLESRPPRLRRERGERFSRADRMAPNPDFKPTY